jgi:hypothetical protein
VVGFYGGINYGFGYFGRGFSGGRWEGGHFFYNSAVWHVNRTEIRNVYEERVNVRENVRVSYNGGRGGIEARPSREEESAAHERHIPADQNQIRHEEAARSNREFKNSVNHGRPPVTATLRPGEFSGHDAVPGRETTRAETGPRIIRCIRKICPRINVRQLRIREIRRWIRSIRSNRKIWRESRINSGRSFSSNRIGSISSTRSRTPTKREISSSSRSTRNRRNKCSNGTYSSSSNYSKNSSQLIKHQGIKSQPRRKSTSCG